MTAFANEVVDAGFTVVMPSLLGTPGRRLGRLRTVVDGSRCALSKEFTSWALKQTSPIIAWLRAFARELHGEVGGPGVGAVGMCFAAGSRSG